MQSFRPISNLSFINNSIDQIDKLKNYKDIFVSRKQSVSQFETNQETIKDSKMA